MRRGLERGALAAGLLVLMASLQFVACLLGPAAALPVAVLLGVGITLLWLRLELVGTRPWLSPLLFTAVAILAVTTTELSLRSSFATWFAPLMLGAASAVTLYFQLQSRARCGLCDRRLGRGALAFRCPRCTQTVCDETCWDFEHRRCRLCLEQRVPILPVQESWWLRVTGPRAQNGRCSLCLGAADAVDLRLCPNCRRPQCRPCWDFSNGECARCGTALPDLPASLTMAVVQVPADTQ